MKHTYRKCRMLFTKPFYNVTIQNGVNLFFVSFFFFSLLLLLLLYSPTTNTHTSSLNSTSAVRNENFRIFRGFTVQRVLNILFTLENAIPLTKETPNILRKKWMRSLRAIREPCSVTMLTTFCIWDPISGSFPNLIQRNVYICESSTKLFILWRTKHFKTFFFVWRLIWRNSSSQTQHNTTPHSQRSDSIEDLKHRIHYVCHYESLYK